MQHRISNHSPTPERRVVLEQTPPVFHVEMDSGHPEFGKPEDIPCYSACLFFGLSLLRCILHSFILDLTLVGHEAALEDAIVSNLRCPHYAEFIHTGVPGVCRCHLIKTPTS